MPIVLEAEQIPNRRNSPLNSRALIFDGSGETVLRRARKDFALLDQRVMIAQNDRVGVRGVGDTLEGL